MTPSLPRQADVVVLGAGAAGLFCGARIAEGGLSVLVLDHAKKPAEKVRISGGGRCNFTNIHTGPHAFLSQNPHFAKSALARYTPDDFIARLDARAIGWHEKTLGQLFCDGRSGAIIDMLTGDLLAAGGQLALSTAVTGLERTEDGFRIATGTGEISAGRLIIATGGLSIPKMGATGFAYEVARQFGHGIIDPRPALVPFVFEGDAKTEFASISGVSLPVAASYHETRFDEAMLFTHRGLSGPVILQISSYWRDGHPVTIDLLPGVTAAERLKAAKAAHPKQSLATALETLLPKRLVALLAVRGDLPDVPRLADLSHDRIDAIVDALSGWALKPAGTEGWRTAEVTRGGVATDGLSSRSMESRTVPGLYFIGECVDVTGWLGGYNFQWAWASAWAAAGDCREKLGGPPLTN